jgi:hypothetical protein
MGLDGERERAARLVRALLDEGLVAKVNEHLTLP